MNIFFTSDWHLWHKGILTFKNKDGTPLRPFYSIEEMHEALIENHNKLVKTGDTVYVLGDVSMGPQSKLGIVERFNGVKRLVAGNHDELRAQRYLEHFVKLRGITHKKGVFLSHVPLHPHSLRERGPTGAVNIHGHLHNNRVTRPAYGQFAEEIDPWYFSVCPEVNSFAPVALETIKQHFKHTLGKDIW